MRPARRGRTGALVELPDGIRGAADGPMYLRLYRHVRDAILSGALPPGRMLPAGRTLADDLGVSRNTVEAALEQLRAEGFLERRVGVGTRVAPGLPGGARPARALPLRRPAGPEPVLSSRGRATIASDHLIDSTVGFTFAPCIPDAQVLPGEAWRRIVARRGRRWSADDTIPPEPGGHRPLREAVAAYLASARGVRCDWSRVVVLSSVQQGLSLLATLLLDPADAVWLEDPGYPGARGAFAAAGARIVPVPVDRQGLDVAAGEALAPAARLAYVTPSHQYPLGVTLSLTRRMTLLEWAARVGAWIVEDDYDSEFRYSGRPLASIQGLDTAGRVIYAGTFNKVLSPSIRLAYLVVPPGLAAAFEAAQKLAGGMPSRFVQSVIAEFIDGGQFAGHVRKVREVYRQRREALLEAAGRELRGRVRLGPADAGLHVAALLERGDDRALSARAAQRRLDLPALSRYYAGPAAAHGLLVHYAGTPVPMIRDGVRALAELLDGRA